MGATEEHLLGLNIHGVECGPAGKAGPWIGVIVKADSGRQSSSRR